MKRISQRVALWTGQECRDGVMRWGRLVLGAAMDVVGLVWFLQGIRVLPGSFMTGSTFWAVVGLLVMMAGMATVLTAVRR